MSYAGCESRDSSRILLYIHPCISNEPTSYAVCEIQEDSHRILLYTLPVNHQRSHELCGLRIKEIAVASCCTCILCISNQATSNAARELKRDSSRILLYTHLVCQQ